MLAIRKFTGTEQPEDVGEMTTALEWVTPEMAAQMLEHEWRENRRVDQDRVDYFAEMMVKNQWRKSHQGIAIEEDGTLSDGQHRLLAIVKANRPVLMLVSRGVPREARPVIDSGKMRSISFRLGVSNEKVAIIRSALVGRSGAGGRKNANPFLVDALLRRLSEEVSVVVASMPHSHVVGRSPYRAAVLRAMVAEPKNNAKIVEFARQACEQEAHISDARTPSTLVRHLAERNRGIGGPRERGDAYSKTQCAIRAHCEGRSMAWLVVPDSDLYPWPDGFMDEVGREQ